MSSIKKEETDASADLEGNRRRPFRSLARRGYRAPLSRHTSLRDWFVSSALVRRCMLSAGGSELTELSTRTVQQREPAESRALRRRRHNKSRNTNRIPQATSHGVTPLGRLKENRKLPFQSFGTFRVLFSWSNDATTKVTFIYITFKYSTHASLTAGGGKVQLSFFFFFFSLWANGAARTGGELVETKQHTTPSASCYGASPDPSIVHVLLVSPPPRRIWPDGIAPGFSHAKTKDEFCRQPRIWAPPRRGCETADTHNDWFPHSEVSRSSLRRLSLLFFSFVVHWLLFLFDFH